MSEILMNVLAISNEANTSFGSSKKLMIRFAAGCCFVLSILISLLLSEKMATSAPEMVKLSNSKASKRTTSNVVTCGLAASNQ